MKITLTVTLAMSLVFAAAANAAEKTPQQQRMTTCNQEAKTKALKGDERKGFMSNCLKGGAAQTDGKSLTPQQQKMRECNATATQQSLKGDDRKKFMGACLKKAA